MGICVQEDMEVQVYKEHSVWKDMRCKHKKCGKIRKTWAIKQRIKLHRK